MKALLAGLFVLLSLPAWATPDLRGNWKFEKQECLSGAPPKAVSDQGLKINYEVFANFTDTSMQVKYTATVTYDKALLDPLIAQEQAELAQPHTDAEKAELQHAIAEMQRYENGVSCQVSEDFAFKVTDTVLHIGPGSHRESTCDGDHQEPDKTETDSDYKLNGDTLLLTDRAPETHADAVCPAGDRNVTTFKRVVTAVTPAL